MLPPRLRSLSAVTWSMVAKTRGFPLCRHSVFFSRDYSREFAEIFGRHDHLEAVSAFTEKREPHYTGE